MEKPYSNGLGYKKTEACAARYKSGSTLYARWANTMLYSTVIGTVLYDAFFCRWTVLHKSSRAEIYTVHYCVSSNNYCTVCFY